VFSTYIPGDYSFICLFVCLFVYLFVCLFRGGRLCLRRLGAALFQRLFTGSLAPPWPLRCLLAQVIKNKKLKMINKIKSQPGATLAPSLPHGAGEMFFPDFFFGAT
jgi:hypothetical protein